MLLTPLFLPPQLQGAVGAPGPKGARGSAGPPVSIWILWGGGCTTPRVGGRWVCAPMGGSAPPASRPQTMGAVWAGNIMRGEGGEPVP